MFFCANKYKNDFHFDNLGNVISPILVGSWYDQSMLLFSTVINLFDKRLSSNCYSLEGYFLYFCFIFRNIILSTK
jgi:hypothetical protein